MSVSTVAGPAYNKFYDQTSVSDGGSADSFIVARRRDSGERRRRGGGARETDDEGLLSTFMKPFAYCCAPFRRGGGTGEAYTAGSEAGAGRLAGGSSEYFDGQRLKGLAAAAVAGRDSEGEESSGSSAGGTYAYVPRGAKAQTLAAGATDGRRRSSAVEAVDDAGGIVTWSVELPVNYVEAKEALNAGERQLAVLLWCVQNEQSAHMTERLLRILDTECRKMDGAASDFNLDAQMQKEDYAVLDVVRKIEARLIQEVLGDLFKCVEELQGTGGLYLVLTRDETSVGVYARTQGEATFLSLYMPHPVGKHRTPGFFGFSKVEDIGTFVSDVFKVDSSGGGASGRFQARILKSKHAYLQSAQGVRKDWEKEPAKAKVDVWEEGNEKSDPRHQAKVVYSAMYDATKKNTGNERVFSWAPQAGMYVQTDAEVRREYAFQKGEKHENED